MNDRAFINQLRRLAAPQNKHELMWFARSEAILHVLATAERPRSEHDLSAWCRKMGVAVHVGELPADRLGKMLVQYADVLFSDAAITIILSGQLTSKARVEVLSHELGHLAYQSVNFVAMARAYHRICQSPLFEYSIGRFITSAEGLELAKLQELQADFFAARWLSARSAEHGQASTVTRFDDYPARASIGRRTLWCSQRLGYVSSVNDAVHALVRPLLQAMGEVWSPLPVPPNGPSNPEDRFLRRISEVDFRAGLGAGDMLEPIIVIVEGVPYPSTYVPLIETRAQSGLAWKNPYQEVWKAGRGADSWLDVARRGGYWLMLFGRSSANPIQYGQI